MQAKPPLAFDGQRIGLLGGSFNPPHDAHRMISETALRRLDLDAVWWIVTPGNPLKSHDELLSQQSRIALSEKLLTNPRIIPTGFEAELPSAYTAATLAFLRHRYGNVRFVWLMGADNLAGFHRWQRWREIAATFPIAIIDRPTYRLRAMASPAAHALHKHFVPERFAKKLASRAMPGWTVLTVRLSDLSSTELRRHDKPQSVRP
ncbi:MAG: nicotinate-nucleotide adenylyltransferase [Pseudomonadota bacterium]